MVREPPIDPEPHERVSEEHERARALADVLRDQEERAQAALEAEERRHRWNQARRGVLATTWAVAAWIWIFSPGWTRVESPPLPPLEHDMRAVRVHLFLQSQQVEAFHRERGRLPWVLQETGPPLPGMEYQRVDNQTYELQARSDRVRLVYSSRRPAHDFVGSDVEILGSGSAVRADLEELAPGDGP